MTASIPRLRLVAPEPVKPAPQSKHVVFTSQDRMAWDSIFADVQRVNRAFSGPSSTLTAAAEIDARLAQISDRIKDLRKALR